MNLNKQNEKQSPLKKGQSAKVKAFTAHFPLKKERNFNSIEVIAEHEKLLIFTDFAFAKSEPRITRIFTNEEFMESTDEHK